MGAVEFMPLSLIFLSVLAAANLEVDGLFVVVILLNNI